MCLVPIIHIRIQSLHPESISTIFYPNTFCLFYIFSFDRVSWTISL